MSRPQNSCQTLPHSQNSQSGPQKVKKMTPKISKNKYQNGPKHTK